MIGSAPGRERRPAGARFPLGRSLGVLFAAAAGFLGAMGCGGGGGGLLVGVPTINPAQEPPPGVDQAAVVNPNSIAVVSISQSAVALLGSGGNTNSSLTFEVRNELGQGLQDVCVSFTLENGGLGGSEELNPKEAPANGCNQLTNGLGQILTNFRSGTQAGTVNVIAWIDTDMDQRVDNGEIKATATVSVNSGPPFGNHIATVTENPNHTIALNDAGSLAVQGLLNATTTFLSDRFTNAVPDNTAVTFRTFDPVALTASSQVQGSGTTTGGNSSVQVNTRSQSPAPADGVVESIGFTQGGADAAVLSLHRGPATLGSPLFAGTDGGGIYRSFDNGGSWQLVGEPETGLFDGYVREMVANPINTNETFAVTNRGVFSSITGVNWERRDGLNKIFNELPTPLPSNGGGCPANSTDRWRLRSIPLNQARIAIRVDNLFTDRFYLDTTQVLNLTQGATEAQRCIPDNTPGNIRVDYDNANRLPDRPATSIVGDPAGAGGRLYVGMLGAGVYRTDNSGLDWTPINSNLSNVNVTSLAFDTDDNSLWAATEGGGVYRNPNPSVNGTPWVQLNGGGATQLLDLNITSIAVGVGGSNLVMVGTKNAGVQFSTTVGASWQVPAGDPFRSATPPDVEVSRVRNLGGNSFVVTTLNDENPLVQKGNVYRTSTAVPAFTAAAATGLSSRFLYDALVNGTQVILGTRGRGVFLSNDSGASFAEISGAVPNRIGNNLFAGVTFMYGGPTNIRAYVVPTVGLGGGSQTIANGDQRRLRVFFTEGGNERPLSNGSTVGCLVTTVSGDEGARLFGKRNLEIPVAIHSASEVTDFLYTLQNNVATATAGQVDCSVTSDNGNETLSVPFFFQ